MVLVKQYDGRKPLIDIVEDSPFKPFDTIKITFRLAELGAIVRRETRQATPLTERLAVRDWLLGGADEPKERPVNGANAGGVTEAGRRAAEAYHAAATARAAEKSPADDILDDSAAVRAVAPAPAPRKKAAAKKSKKAAAPAAAPQAGKLSPQAAASAPEKEPLFDALEEDFFAREADLHRPSTIDTFDDLEPHGPHKKQSLRRDWFGTKKK
jgi:hypothetical protein